MSRPFLLLAVFLLASPARAGTWDVRIQNFQFTGQHLTIQLGDTVRWTAFESGHTCTEGTDLVLDQDEAWHEPMSNGEVFSRTFDAAFLAAHPRPGNEYGYFCVPHSAGMRGTIKVVSGPGLPFCFCEPFGPPACSNRDHGAGCVNSGSVRGGRMLATGSASVAADDMQFIVDHLPANQPTILISGKTLIAQTQMADGWRCIGSPFFRVASGSTGPNGVFTRGPGVVNNLQAKAHVQAGQTWRFQLWYRDTVFGCGNSANVSNGYVVTFTP